MTPRVYATNEKEFPVPTFKPFKLPVNFLTVSRREDLQNRTAWLLTYAVMSRSFPPWAKPSPATSSRNIKNKLPSGSYQNLLVAALDSQVSESIAVLMDPQD
ncbi:unnamed protein product [Calypogeia fissa]